MASKKVLIVHSGTFGYVEEISREIVRILEENGLNVHLINLLKTKRSRWPYLQEYDGILVGATGPHGGSRAGPSRSFFGLDPKMMKDARNFVKENLNEIVQKRKTLGIFRSDPFDFIVILNPDQSSIKLEQAIMKRFGFKPSICAWFGPVFDFKSKKIRQDTKKMVRRELRKLSRESGIEFDLKGCNDFRDWDRIRNFALKFAGMVDSSIKPTSTKPGNQCPNCGKKIDPSWKFCVNCNYKL